jgi:hypothetical protein
VINRHACPVNGVLRREEGEGGGEMLRREQAEGILMRVSGWIMMLSPPSSSSPPPPLCLSRIPGLGQSKLPSQDLNEV